MNLALAPTDACEAAPGDGGVRFADAALLAAATTTTERLCAWRLTYARYRRAGLAGERADGLWYGAHDLVPESRCLLLRAGGRERATVTVVGDGPCGLPADTLYAAELGALRAAGCRLQELISFAIVEDDPRIGLIRLFQLYRGCVAVAAAQRRDAVAITVHPRHAAIYIRSLRFTQIGPERSYAKVSGAPAVLLLQDLRDAARRFADQPPGCPPALWRALRDRAQGDELARFFARPAPHRPIHQESP